MTSWLRRLSRDRSSSKNEDDLPPHYPSKTSTSRPPTSYNEPSHHSDSGYPASATARKDSQFSSSNHNSNDMLRRSAQADGQYYSPSQQHFSDAHHRSSDPNMRSTAPNGLSSAGAVGVAPHASLTSAPDPLTRAFNEALAPYMSQIEMLQNQLNDTTTRLKDLESERAAMHAWIDKRGLRPDLPAELARGIAPSSLAASTLATQLDRKMTMVNYSLHHLSDSLPGASPSSTSTSALLTLLPSVQHLATLPSGPAPAFESLIKLAGNLNSHSTGEETQADHEAIFAFYNQLDETMVSVIGKRMLSAGNGEEEWDVGRDVRRLEKTGTFLRKEMGVRNYFIRGLEIMRGQLPNRSGRGLDQDMNGYAGETRYSDGST